MTKLIVEIPDDIIPKGYEPTGEVRCPEPNELFLSSNGFFMQAITGYSYGPRLILRAKPPVYREPTMKDVGRNVEVCDGGGTWICRKLLAVMTPRRARFICEDMHGPRNPACDWENARIEVTE